VLKVDPELLSVLAVVGSTGDLNEPSALVPPSITGLCVAKILPALVFITACILFHGLE
jgi:hypothetical protein